MQGEPAAIEEDLLVDPTIDAATRCDATIGVRRGRSVGTRTYYVKIGRKIEYMYIYILYSLLT